MEESFSKFKEELLKLEKQKKYFFIKRYYLFRKIIISFMLIAFVVLTYGIIVLYNRTKNISYNEKYNNFFVTDYQGEVKINNTKNIFIGQTITNGSSIEVYNNSYLILQVFNGHYIKIYPNTYIDIVDLKLNNLNKKYKKIILNSGKIETITYDNNSTNQNYYIETISAYIKISVQKVIIVHHFGRSITKLKNLSNKLEVISKTTFIEKNSGFLNQKNWYKLLNVLSKTKIYLNKNEEINFPQFKSLDNKDIIILVYSLNSPDFSNVLKEYIYKLNSDYYNE